MSEVSIQPLSKAITDETNEGLSGLEMRLWAMQTQRLERWLSEVSIHPSSKAITDETNEGPGV